MRVPTSQNRVAPDALPGFRQRQNYGAEHFGGIEAGQMVENGKLLGRIAVRLDEKETADVQNLFNTFRQEVSHRFENNEDGFFTREGAEVEGTYERAGIYMDEVSGRYTEGLSGSARKKFESLSMGVKTSYLSTADRFEAKGLRAYEDASFQAAQAGLTDDIIRAEGDKDRSMPLIESKVASVRAKYAPYGEEIVNQKVQEELTNTHISVVTGLVGKNPIAAQKWLETFEDQIGPAVKDELAGKVDKAVFTGISANLYESTYSQFQGDIEKGRAFVKAQAAALYPNQPNMQKQLIKGYDTHWKTEEGVRKEVQGAKLDGFYTNVVTGAEGFTNYKAAYQNLMNLDLDGDKLKTADTYLRAKFGMNEDGGLKKSPPGNKLNAIFDIASGKYTDVAAFSKAYHGKLSDNDYVTLASGLIKDPASGQAQGQVIANVFKTSDLPEDDYSEFNEWVQGDIKAFLSDKGRQPNQMEIENMAIEAAKKKVKRRVEGRIYDSTSKVPAYHYGNAAREVGEDGEVLETRDGKRYITRKNPFTGETEVMEIEGGD